MRFDFIKNAPLLKLHLTPETVALGSFDYISGANIGSKKLEMTVPVTQSEKIDMTIPVTQSINGKNDYEVLPA